MMPIIVEIIKILVIQLVTFVIETAKRKYHEKKKSEPKE